MNKKNILIIAIAIIIAGGIVSCGCYFALSDNSTNNTNHSEINATNNTNNTTNNTQVQQSTTKTSSSSNTENNVKTSTKTSSSSNTGNNVKTSTKKSNSNSDSASAELGSYSNPKTEIDPDYSSEKRKNPNYGQYYKLDGGLYRDDNQYTGGAGTYTWLGGGKNPYE